MGLIHGRKPWVYCRTDSGPRWSQAQNSTASLGCTSFSGKKKKKNLLMPRQFLFMMTIWRCVTFPFMERHLGVHLIPGIRIGPLHRALHHVLSTKETSKQGRLLQRFIEVGGHQRGNCPIWVERWRAPESERDEGMEIEWVLNAVFHAKRHKNNKKKKISESLKLLNQNIYSQLTFNYFLPVSPAMSSESVFLCYKRDQQSFFF